jgi:hypothetical protein
VTAETAVSAGGVLTALWGGDPDSGKVRVNLSGPPTGAQNQPVEYILSAANMNKLATVTLWLEVDGTYLAGQSAEGLNGFQTLGGVLWQQKGDSHYVGRVTLYNTSGGVTSEGYQELLRITLTARDTLGSSEVKIDRISLSGYDADNHAVFLDSVTQNGAVGTEIVPHFSPYDVNRDGKVDQLDLTTAQRYYAMSSDDADWDDLAARADVTGDGSVDINDFILILNNIGW